MVAIWPGSQTRYQDEQWDSDDRSESSDEESLDEENRDAVGDEVFEKIKDDAEREEMLNEVIPLKV